MQLYTNKDGKPLFFSSGNADFVSKIFGRPGRALIISYLLVACTCIAAYNLFAEFIEMIKSKLIYD